MQYLLLIYNNESAMLSRPAEEEKQSMAACMAYAETMRKAGV